MEMKREITKIAAILWVLVVLGGLQAQAEPIIIDGRFDPLEDYSYSTSYWVDFTVEGGKDQDPLVPVFERGELWTYHYVDPSSGNLSVAFIQPKSLVDNNYGTTAVGWGSYTENGKNHKFQDLIGSDDAQFIFTDGLGDTVLDITLDYLHGYGSRKEDPPYASGGVVDGEGSVNFGSASDILAVATSLQYNWDTFGSSYPGYFGKDSDSPLTGSQDPTDPTSYTTVDPALSDWVFDVTYEFQISGSLFNTNGFVGITIPLVHDSPNKIGKNKVYDDLELFPVPSAVILGVIGLGFSSWLGRRKFSV